MATAGGGAASPPRLGLGSLPALTDRWRCGGQCAANSPATAEAAGGFAELGGQQVDRVPFAGGFDQPDFGQRQRFVEFGNRAPIEPCSGLQGHAGEHVADGDYDVRRYTWRVLVGAHPEPPDVFLALLI